MDLEEVLGQLLIPDNNVIQQATERLQQIYREPQVVLALGDVLQNSTNPQIRQFAAILLRKKVIKQNQWRILDVTLKQGIKNNILNMLIRENEKIVQKSLAQVIASIAKHELPSKEWPEFMSFLQQYTASDNLHQREGGMYVLSVVSSVAGQQLTQHIQSLLNLFTQTISDQDSLQVQFYTIKTMSHLVYMIGSDNQKKFQVLIPKVLKTIDKLIQVDQTQACEALEVFDELVESEVTVLVPYVKPMVLFCLELSSKEGITNELKVKGMSLIMALTRLKKKAILKQNLMKPIVDTMFKVMCQYSMEDPDEEEMTEGDEGEGLMDASSSSRPDDIAAQVIDTMALHMPPVKFMKLIRGHIEPALSGSYPLHRKAAYITLAVCTEGCSDHIRHKYLESLLDLVFSGISESEQFISNAAMYALGQFAEHLQPDISKFAPKIIPRLFEYLTKVISNPEIKTSTRALTKTYYAVETFCENLGTDILPYLPGLMEHLLSVLSTETSRQHKGLAISCLGAAASAARGEMLPYFEQVINHFKVFLEISDNEEMLSIQTQALDTLGVFARTIGADNFVPIAGQSLQLGLNLIELQKDPDLRRCVYGLFAAISSVLKSHMVPYLQKIVGHMIESLQSSEGITTHYEKESEMFNFFDEDLTEESGDETEDCDDSDVQGVSIENAYLEEKEDTCCALGELALNTGAGFLPFVEQSFQEVFKMASYPAVNVRKGAVTALSQMCLGLHSIKDGDLYTADVQNAYVKTVNATIPKYGDIIQKEEDRHVVITTLECLTDILAKIKGSIVLNQDLSSLIAKGVNDVLMKKTHCQDNQTDDDETEDEGEGEGEASEYDLLLLETAADVIPALGQVIGGQLFKSYFTQFLPQLLKRLKMNTSQSDRSLAVGTLAECVEALGEFVQPFLSQLYPVLRQNFEAEDSEMRSNSVFAMGILVSNSKHLLYSKYSDILKMLFDLLSHETDRRVVDNICGAICRLIWTNSDLVPLPEVLPVVLQCLPLGEDFEENRTVFSCLGQLSRFKNESLMENMPQFLKAIGHVINTDQITPEIKVTLVDIVKQSHLENAANFMKVISSFPPDVREAILQYTSMDRLAT